MQVLPTIRLSFVYPQIFSTPRRFRILGIVSGLLVATLTLAQAPAPAAPTPGATGVVVGGGTPPASTPRGTATPTSGDDFTGDRVILYSTMGNFRNLRDQSIAIAPSGTALIINADERFSGPNVDQSKTRLFVRVVSTRCETIVDKQNQTTNATRTVYLGVSKFANCPAGTLVQEDESYEIDRAELSSYGYHRSGWTYGALLIPYKYHLDDKSFDGATTIGPYVGYRQGWIGLDTALIASIGLSSLTVASTTATGGTTTSTQQGFTLAWGLTTSISKNNNPLQLGIMFGKDWAGSNAAVPYKHEGKTWVAAQFGFAFTK